MSEQQHEEKAGSPGVNENRAASPDLSDRETDAFEDAVDTGSIRSLTKRKPSTPQQPSEERLGSDASEASPKSIVVPEDSHEEESGPDADEPNEEAQERSQQEDGLRRLSSTTAASLDNVSLGDEAAAPPTNENTHEANEASRTISLSSITNSLPAMPWSPPPQNEPPPRVRAASPPMPPPQRKLTSAFSWLSRNPSKESSSPSLPATASTRRNTASSIATLTSNPEMMLGKLEEEKGGRAGPQGTKSNLKDRFKMLRMREEASAAAYNSDDEKTGNAPRNSIAKAGSAGLGGTEDKDGNLALQPTAPPVPTSPNPGLAPGTASGVNAGPSSITDMPVDWDLWQSVVYEGPAAVARTSAEELNKAIATGIPNAIRGVIWQVMAQSKNEELEAVYHELVARGTDKERKRNSNGTDSTTSNGNLSVNKEPASSASSVHSDQLANHNGAPSPPEKDAETNHKANATAAAERKKREKEDAAMLQKLEKTIRRDLGARTSYSKFAAAQGLQEGLFNVCKAYALYDDEVGYAQGMNFLVMPLLFNMPAEEAFCLLVRLMQHYHLRDLFIQDMPGLHKYLYLFERLLEDVEPALYCHLHRRGISPHLYATQWFLTLFAYRFPLQLVLRIYDLIFSEGLSAVLRFGIVLMQKNAAALVAMSDMAQLSTFLKDRLFDAYIDATPSSNSILENGFFGSSSSSIDKEVYRADQLVRDACEVKLTPELLKSYTTEWEEKTRAEKERETELLELRAANTNLAVKVRKLEERIETVDREQAALATELVRTKVDNEELKDENESLRGQVRELKIVIEKQPQEIEDRWTLERDDLMKRNQRVHEENQKLENELTELEEELVETKMRYAEVNSQHETLTRKWTELKRQFA